MGPDAQAARAAYNGCCHDNPRGPSPWTSVPAPATPERQRALPDAPAACPRCGACAWRRNGTHPRHLVVLGRLRVQRLARERPPEAGPVLLALWEAVMQGRVRLRPEVQKLL